MGRSTLEYASLISGTPFAGLLPIPPHWDSRLPISIRIPRVRSKGHTPRAALLHETCALIEQWYSGRLHLYTDGSVKEDGSAAAASVIPALRDERKCRLPLPATSTTAELAALNLAADQLAELLPSSAVIFCDSQVALLTLARGENGTSIAQRLTRKFTVIVRSGCDVFFQWVPSHVGVRGNEAADELARDAHDPSTPTTNFVRNYDVARLIIARHVRALHPDPRTAAGTPVARLPSTGIGNKTTSIGLPGSSFFGNAESSSGLRAGAPVPLFLQVPTASDHEASTVTLQAVGHAPHRLYKEASPDRHHSERIGQPTLVGLTNRVFYTSQEQNYKHRIAWLVILRQRRIIMWTTRRRTCASVPTSADCFGSRGVDSDTAGRWARPPSTI
ncbi:hypothetical protein MRX96_037555 [Rhipicephalus microplus]